MRASTAAGDKRVRIFQDAKVSLQGREGVFQCLELLGGEHPRLGAIPLEDLGVEIDLQKHILPCYPKGLIAHTLWLTATHFIIWLAAHSMDGK